jgi:hypothetical protein
MVFLGYFFVIEAMFQRVEKSPFREFLVHIAVDSKPGSLAAQFELSVAPADSYEIPAVVLNKELYYLSYLHRSILSRILLIFSLYSSSLRYIRTLSNSLPVIFFSR